MTRILVIDYAQSVSLAAETHAKLRAALEVHRDDLPELKQAGDLVRQSQEVAHELQALVARLPKRLRVRQVVMSTYSSLPAPRNLSSPETEAERDACEHADALVEQLREYDAEASRLITLLSPGTYKNAPVVNIIDGRAVVRGARQWLQRVDVFCASLRDAAVAQEFAALTANVTQALDRLDDAVNDLPPFMNGRVLRTEHGLSSTVVGPLTQFERAAGVLSGQVSRAKRGLTIA